MEVFNCATEGKLIFKECIQPKLKGEGFKKSGNTFYRLRGEFIDIVNVQFGRSNSKDYSYFTYNIKIAMPSFFKKFNIEREKEIDCCIIDNRFSFIIRFMKNLFHVDYWYKIGHRGPDNEIITNLINNGCNTPGVTPERIEELKEELKTLNLLESRYDFNNIKQIRETVTSDIDEIVIPFFDKIDSADALIEFIYSKRFLLPIEKLFSFAYFIEKGEINRGIELAKSLYSSEVVFIDQIDKYLYDKGLHSYIE